jgi:hypothetical protein
VGPVSVCYCAAGVNWGFARAEAANTARRQTTERPRPQRQTWERPNLTPSLDFPPLQTEPPLLEADFGGRGPCAATLNLSAFRQRPRALDSIAPRLSGVESLERPSPENTPTHHLRPRRLQTTRLHAYAAPSSSPHNTTCWPLHPARPQHTALAQQKSPSDHAPWNAPLNPSAPSKHCSAEGRGSDGRIQ